jgi:hypothetical protein
MDLPEMYWSQSRGLITRVTEGLGKGRLLISAYRSGSYLNDALPADSDRLFRAPSKATLDRAAAAARAEFWDARMPEEVDNMWSAIAEAAINAAQPESD